jgi:polysaccharide pyruvyl transferase WcaK-like protein
MSKVVKTLNVLHLASFAGNIGDLANHAGARSMFEQHLDFKLLLTELEIREFYWKQRSFDAEFVRYANTFDLVIIGGGNYFELWVQNSATGTSIDIAPHHLAELTTPTIFYSLGVDTGQGYTEQSANRFRAFMSEVLGRADMFVCVRNDGSSLALKNVLGAEAKQIPMMPDGGFFACVNQIPKEVNPDFGSSIGINIAGDMLERRFDGEISPNEFLENMARTIITLLEKKQDLRIELVPHIWRDVTVIANLLPLIPDRYLRKRVTIAPLAPIKSGLPDFLSGYAKHDLVLGMRFHANVCCIGMNVPTIGLLNYPQVELLYDELNLTERLVDVRKANFSTMLERIALDDLHDLSPIRAHYQDVMHMVTAQASETLNKLNTWLHARFD